MNDSPELLGAARVRELAARLGLRPTKQWGQNFVVDANTVRRIVRLAGVGARRHRRRGRSRSRLADPGPAARSSTASWPSRSTRSSPGPCPTPSRGSRPTQTDRLDVVLADALHRDRAARPAPDRARRQPALQRLGAGRAALPRALPDPRAGARHGAARGGRAARRRRRARAPTGCRASRPPGTPTCGSRARCRAASSGRCPTSTPASSRWSAAPPPVTTATRAGGVPLHRRGVRPAPQDPARRAGGLGGLAGPGRGGPASRPASTRAPAASSSTSRRSRRSPPREQPARERAATVAA